MPLLIRRSSSLKPISYIFSFPLHTLLLFETQYLRIAHSDAINLLLHPLTPKRGIPSFWKELLGTNPAETGPVAQRIRARGYEPRCRGFESLLAHPERGQKGGLSGVGRL